MRRALPTRGAAAGAAAEIGTQLLEHLPAGRAGREGTTSEKCWAGNPGLQLAHSTPIPSK